MYNPYSLFSLAGSSYVSQPAPSFQAQAHSYASYPPTAGSYYYLNGPGFYPSQPQHPHSSRYMSYPSHLMSNTGMPFHNMVHTTLASEIAPSNIPPQIQRPILGNTTATVVNVPLQTAARPTWKRKRAPTASALTDSVTPLVL